MRAAARALLDRAADEIGTSHEFGDAGGGGAAGAVGWDEAGRHAAPGLAVDVVDTTGAGDSFDAGFLAAMLGGLPFADCLRHAAVAGSLSTRRAGGTAAQATRAELAGLV